MFASQDFSRSQGGEASLDKARQGLLTELIRERAVRDRDLAKQVVRSDFLKFGLNGALANRRPPGRPPFQLGGNEPGVILGVA